MSGTREAESAKTTCFLCDELRRRSFQFRCRHSAAAAGPFCEKRLSSNRHSPAKLFCPFLPTPLRRLHLFSLKASEVQLGIFIWKIPREKSNYRPPSLGLKNLDFCTPSPPSVRPSVRRSSVRTDGNGVRKHHLPSLLRCRRRWGNLLCSPMSFTSGGFSLIFAKRKPYSFDTLHYQLDGRLC